jgi:hypothetical protein
MFRKKLVDMEVRTDATSSDVAEARLIAQKSETVAKKSLEVAQACRTDLKALEGRMPALRKIQDDMVLYVSRLQALPAQQQGATAGAVRTDEASENSIFLAGIPVIRDRL